MGIWANWRWSVASKHVLLWVAMGIGVALIFVVISIYGFLAVNDPVGEGVLVVEAWVSAKTLAESAIAFNSTRYRYLVVVGGPMQGSDNKPNAPTTYADLAASNLEKLGFDTKRLVRINVPAVSSGRTLAEATAVGRWLDSSGISVCCVDVFTVGVHARKSWILFRHALGVGYRVGIIAGSPDSYDPRFWLASRSGVRIVARNVAGYVYSKLWLLFHRKLLPSQGFSFPAEADRHGIPIGCRHSRATSCQTVRDLCARFILPMTDYIPLPALRARQGTGAPAYFEPKCTGFLQLNSPLRYFPKPR